MKSARSLPFAISRLALLAAIIASAACAQTGAGGMSQEQVVNEFYASQLSTLTALEQTVGQLSQEYYMLDIEYQSMGRPELAEAARKRAERLQAQQAETQKKLAELQTRGARAKRGEVPSGVTIRPSQAPAPAPAKAPARAGRSTRTAPARTAPPRAAPITQAPPPPAAPAVAPILQVPAPAPQAQPAPAEAPVEAAPAPAPAPAAAEPAPASPAP